MTIVEAEYVLSNAITSARGTRRTGDANGAREPAQSLVLAEGRPGKSKR